MLPTFLASLTDSLPLFTTIWPEILLVSVACVLFLMGASPRPATRRIAPLIALISLGIVFAVYLIQSTGDTVDRDPWDTLLVFKFAGYIKMIGAGVGILLLLLAWPTNADATGNPAISYGHDAAEFFALMLLSIAGVFLVASANDIILLFLGIELASIPTYIMVSISRPLPVAQEAGVKYFFLGAMAAAVMLFGFSYLYGVTGETRLDLISNVLHTGTGNGGMNNWQLLAVLMLMAGFAFKIAAVPLHAYAGDVYQGAATPVTAFLAFVPKTSGFVAIIKILAVIGGSSWAVPDTVVKLLWVLAVLTMTVGNVLGLLQFNVKRVLAYSSVAHTGYMLVGLTALVSAASDRTVQTQALQGVLFYLAAYGVMNAGAFGVLMLLPSRETAAYGRPAPVDGQMVPGETEIGTGATAETFDDLSGQGRRHVGLGLAMAVCCWSLTGIPLSIGFVGKVFLIWPALNLANISTSSDVRHRMGWLVALTMVNAAISAAYYLRIIAAMFLRPEPTPFAAESVEAQPASIAFTARPWPAVVAIGLSVAATLLFGSVSDATNRLAARAEEGVRLDESWDQQAPTTAPIIQAARGE